MKGNLVIAPQVILLQCLLLSSYAMASPRNIYGVGTLSNPSGVSRGISIGAKRLSNPSGVSRSNNFFGVPRLGNTFSGGPLPRSGKAFGGGSNLSGVRGTIEKGFGVGRGYFSAPRVSRQRIEVVPQREFAEEELVALGDAFPQNHDHTNDIFEHF